MIHVIATIETAPGRRDDFLDRVSGPGAGRPGRDGLHRVRAGDRSGRRRSASQPAVRDDVVTVIEKWESVRGARKLILAAPHMVRYRRTVKDLVVGVWKFGCWQPA